jgi:hypothetical protein
VRAAAQGRSLHAMAPPPILTSNRIEQPVGRRHRHVRPLGRCRHRPPPGGRRTDAARPLVGAAEALRSGSPGNFAAFGFSADALRVRQHLSEWRDAPSKETPSEQGSACDEPTLPELVLPLHRNRGRRTRSRGSAPGCRR